MNASELIKRQARALLADVEGVQSIGFSWDWAGNKVLQVDMSPNSDHAGVQQRLNHLDTHVKVREVFGRIKGDSLG